MQVKCRGFAVSMRLFVAAILVTVSQSLVSLITRGELSIQSSKPETRWICAAWLCCLARMLSWSIVAQSWNRSFSCRTMTDDDSTRRGATRDSATRGRMKHRAIRSPCRRRYLLHRHFHHGTEQNHESTNCRFASPLSRLGSTRRKKYTVCSW
jgi:hypothetical protein